MQRSPELTRGIYKIGRFSKIIFKQIDHFYFIINICVPIYCDLNKARFDIPRALIQVYIFFFLANILSNIFKINPMTIRRWVMTEISLFVLYFLQFYFSFLCWELIIESLSTCMGITYHFDSIDIVQALLHLNIMSSVSFKCSLSGLLSIRGLCSLMLFLILFLYEQKT